MKRFISIMLALIMCFTMVTPVFAEGTSPEETEHEASSEQTSRTYLKRSVLELFKNGEITLTEGTSVKAEESSNGQGLMLSGTVADLKALRLSFNTPYDFSGNPVGRIVVDGLGDKKTRASMDVYLDDAEEKVVSVPLRTQMGKKAWALEGERTQDVLDKNIQGEHKVSLGFSFENLEDTDDTSVLLRTVEFAESSIPVMYFNIDESLGTIDAMNSDDQHNTECYGNVDIKIPQNWTPEFKDGDWSAEGLELDYIRGRGNSTWDADKKPYKVKFEEKQDLFGMGANKHWVLLANRYDNSLIRNRMTYWLTRKLSLDNGGVFAPECVPVEVVMNGRYYGSYLLTEQIRVGKTRVNIDDLEEKKGPTATAWPEISGGYLLSKGGDYEENQVVQTARDVDFCIESPVFSEGHTKEAREAQYNYLKDYLQKTEEAIFGKDFKDSTGKGYADYLDVKAAIDYWWIQEFSLNGDAYGNGSTYLYKERDKSETEPGLLYWGPLWDFDYVAWGDLEYNSTPEETFHYTSDPWMNRMLCDPAFVDALKARWPRLDELLEEIVKEGGVIDRYADEVRISERYDLEKYGFYGEDFGQDDADEEQQEGPDVPRTYDTEIEQLRNWIIARRDWAGQKESQDTITPDSFTIDFIIDGKSVETRTYYDGDKYGSFPEVPAKKGYTFTGWKDAFDTYVYATDIVYDVKKVTACYIKNSKLVPPEEIFFAESDVVQTFFPGEPYDEDEEYNMYQSQFTLMPSGSFGEVKWSSSDESAATVDSDGLVTFLSKGTVKITATLPSGKSRSYTLYIQDEFDEIPEMGDFRLNKSSLKMNTGSYTQLRIITDPVPCQAPDLTWISVDTNIVQVDENGVLTAKNPGTTFVLVREGTLDVLKVCKVTVKATTKWKIQNAKRSRTTVIAKLLKGGKTKVTWKKAKYVSGYYIYQSKKANGKYKKIASIKKAKTTKWTKKVKNGRKFYYKVRPFTKVGKKIYVGKWSNAAKAK